MTIKEFAFNTQNHIEATTGADLKRTHIYELISAAFGYNTFAAFSADALFSDKGIGRFGALKTDELIGRAIQLGYPSNLAERIAQCLVAELDRMGISFIKMNDLSLVLTSQVSLSWLKGDFSFDEEDFDDDSADEHALVWADYMNLHASAIFMDDLTQLADKGNPEAIFALARILRCSQPDLTLYEESIRGQKLNYRQQRLVDSYAADALQFERYKHYLKLDAEGGNPKSALEYAETFGDPDFFELAEQASGDIDPLRMVAVAKALNLNDSIDKWMAKLIRLSSKDELKEAANNGSTWAKKEYASYLRDYAIVGDAPAICELIEETLHSNAQEAWMWHYFAMLLNIDVLKYINNENCVTQSAAGRKVIKMPDISVTSKRDSQNKATDMYRQLFPQKEEQQ